MWHLKGFPGGSVVKNLSVKQEEQVRSLGQEDTLEQEMATHSSILAWEIPWTEQPGGLQSMGSQRVQHDCAHVHSCSVHQCYFRGVHRPVLVQECLLLVHDKKVKVSF